MKWIQKWIYKKAKTCLFNLSRSLNVQLLINKKNYWKIIMFNISYLYRNILLKSFNTFKWVYTYALGIKIDGSVQVFCLRIIFSLHAFLHIHSIQFCLFFCNLFFFPTYKGKCWSLLTLLETFLSIHLPYQSYKSVSLNFKL